MNELTQAQMHVKIVSYLLGRPFENTIAQLGILRAEREAPSPPCHLLYILKENNCQYMDQWMIHYFKIT